jgi:Ca-activated chloride channel family protein
VSFALRLLALFLLIAALARPQEVYQESQRQVSGIDIIMVMDVSASMNIEDLSERARLDVAKETMEAFIQARKNDRIGFVIFSGEPLTLAPPTLDYDLVRRQLREVETGVLKDGTAIGDGLSMAVGRLKTSQAKSRVVILLTDGDNNVGQVDPATAGDLAAGFGIRVYTIAIGTEGRVRLPIKTKGALGNTIVSYQWFDNALNPTLLKQIAETTRGKFYRVQDGEALADVFQEIDRLEKSDVKTTENLRYEELFHKFLFWAALLLFLDLVYHRTLGRVLP